MLREQRVDIRFRSSLVSLLFAIFLMATPFQSRVSAQWCNESCGVSSTGCGAWCDWIDQYQYTYWDWYCYGYCDVWMCGIVVEGIFTQQCDTICSYDLYNDYCWVYLE